MKKLLEESLFFILIAFLMSVSYFFMKDLGTVILFLLGIIPLSIFILTFIYTLRNGFRWYISAYVAICWIMASFIIYNSSALFYGVIYVGFVFLAQFLAYLVQKKSNEKKK